MSHQGRFDGITVDQFRARFASTFDVDDYDAMHQAIDGEVMFVVVAKVKGATITESTSGDIVRTNTLKIEQVKAVRKQADREEIADKLALDLPLQLALETTSTVTPPAPVVPAPATPVLDPTPPADLDPFTDDFKVAVGGAAKNDDMLAKFLSTTT